MDNEEVGNASEVERLDFERFLELLTSIQSPSFLNDTYTLRGFGSS